MNIYIDESGSINKNVPKNRDFIIALIVPADQKKLSRVYKRFIKKNLNDLQTLDTNNKMFSEEKKFNELKGSQFSKEMKVRFVDFFSQKKHFEIYYIHIKNCELSTTFCDDKGRAFNYVIQLALRYFIENNFFKDDDYFLQLDNRNEGKKTRYFLEEYLNTELTLSGRTSRKFKVSYFDSADNHFIQIADIFANLLYSHILTNSYGREIKKLKDSGILKFTFVFPKKQC